MFVNRCAMYLLCISIAAVGYSETISPGKKSFNIFVPNLPASNEISGGAIFMRLSGSADYNVKTFPLNENVQTPILSPDWQVQNIKSSFTPGFAFNYQHVFVNNGSDLNLYWAHLRVNNTTSNTAPVSDFEGPLYAVGPESAAISKANGQVNMVTMS